MLRREYKVGSCTYGDETTDSYFLPLNPAFGIVVKIRQSPSKTMFWCGIESKRTLLEGRLMSSSFWLFTLMDYNQWDDMNESNLKSRIEDLRRWWNNI